MGLVETIELEKHYILGSVKIKALNGISISIKEGDFVAIMGASGSGKSTLLNMIGLLSAPTKGKVLLDDVDTSKISKREKADLRLKKIGFIFQFFNLQTNLTALENVMIPYWTNNHTKQESEKRAKQLLKLVGLSKRENHLPSELSGGESQRVAIARALVNSPKILLADEPTGNLDSRTTKDIMELFKELNKEGQTILIVTHEKDIGKIANKRIFLVDGKVANHSSNL